MSRRFFGHDMANLMFLNPSLNICWMVFPVDVKGVICGGVADAFFCVDAINVGCCCPQLRNDIVKLVASSD
jgi:hypothetical protein